MFSDRLEGDMSLCHSTGIGSGEISSNRVYRWLSRSRCGERGDGTGRGSGRRVLILSGGREEVSNTATCRGCLSVGDRGLTSDSKVVLVLKRSDNVRVASDIQRKREFKVGMFDPVKSAIFTI